MKRDKGFIFIAVLYLSILSATSGFCEIYKWIGEDGIVVFSDNPANVPEAQRSKIEKVRIRGESGGTEENQKTISTETDTRANNNITGFSAAQTRVIAATMKEWDAVYTCGREVKVRPFEGFYRDLENGARESVVETAGPGWMNIDPQTRISLRHIVLHAMTHSCQPDEPYILPSPIPFRGVVILGYHGASVIVRLRDGRQTFFRKMEEGLCERNASFFPGYRTYHPSYAAAGKLARQQFPAGEDPMPLIRKNDVPGLIAKIVNKTEASLADVQKVMNMYQEAWTDWK
ncbi:MAG: hypothetical protein CSYNP_03889 [Syntrophus sp. SKADARSKE-3]|nr:hypothetical protein [Syntrophus sp. SKADARSKE-3]